MNNNKMISGKVNATVLLAKILFFIKKYPFFISNFCKKLLRLHERFFSTLKISGAAVLCDQPKIRLYPIMDIFRVLKNPSKFFLLFSICIIGFIGCTSPAIENGKKEPFVEPVVNYSDIKNSAGLNAWFLNDWDGSRAFVDAMKHSRAWAALPEVEDSVCLVDSYGWPLQDAFIVFIAGMIPENDNGIYKLVFEGQATVQLNWVGGSVSTPVWNSTTNLTTVDVTINCNIDNAARLDFTNTKLTPLSPINSGIKNVRLYRPGYESKPNQVFTDPVINGFKTGKIIRFMDWVATNVNPLISWSERTLPAHFSQARQAKDFTVTKPDPYTFSNGAYGVSLEYMIELCNETGCDMWMNIPAMANDEYITKLSKMILYGSDGVEPYNNPVANPVYPPLKSNLKVYIEYANEIWNSANGFWCFYLINNIILNAQPNHPVFYGEDYSDKWSGLFRYPAYRLGEISKILRTVFGDNAMMSRVRPILSTQLGDANATFSKALFWADKYYRVKNGINLNDLYYGGGGSAYFGVTNASTDMNENFDRANYPDALFIKYNTIDSIWAYNYGLKRVAYEGGYGFDSRDGSGNLIYSDATMWNMEADSRTGDVMEKTHIAWSQTGGDELVYYCLTGPAAWGFTKNIMNINTPKFNALKNINNTNRAEVTIGGAIPGTLIATEIYPENSTIRVSKGGWYGKIDEKAVINGFSEGYMIAFPSHTKKAFTGKLTVNGNRWDEGTTVLGIWINGVKQGTVDLVYTAGLTDSTTINVNVPAGLAVIRIEADSGSFAIYSVSIN